MSFRLLVQFCDILCYSEVISLESAEVGEKLPNNLQIFALENVGIQIGLGLGSPPILTLVWPNS